MVHSIFQEAAIEQEIQGRHDDPRLTDERLVMPLQPIYKDEHGTVRFRGNAIVRYLLDNGDVDLNDLAMIDFPQADREQFASLIGYSLSGFSELDYVSDETYEVAERMAVGKQNKAEPRIIQVLVAPNDATWQGALLGLGSDGVTYVCGASGRWENYIPALYERGTEK